MYVASGNSSLRSWGSRHPRAVTGVRIIAGTWSLVLGVILLAHGYQWAWGLFAVSAVIFSAAYVLPQGKPGSRRGGRR